MCTTKKSQRQPFSYPLFGLMHLLLVVALTVRPTRFRVWLFPPIVGIAYHLLYFTTTGVTVNDLIIGPIIPTLVASAFEHIVLSTPQTELSEKSQTLGPSASLWSRVTWALRLMSSPRGVGWSHEPSAVLPPAKYASFRKRKFVADQLISVAVWLLVWDMAATYVRNENTFQPDGLPETGILRRCLFVFAWAAPALAGMGINHKVVSVFMVLLGVWDLTTWRPFFGSLGEAYTIQRFWSRTWHQMIRRSVSLPGRRICTFFGVQHGSALGCLLILYTSFFVSGCIHSVADYMVMDHHGGALRFFMLQAAGITLESTVSALNPSRMRHNAVWKLVGYIWVLLWFSITLPIYIDPQNRAGIVQESVARFSVVEPFVLQFMDRTRLFAQNAH